jgi:hypothetical protein
MSDLPQANSRRSQRVAARIRVTVTRCNGEHSLLSEDTHTLVVNAHGGLIELSMETWAGDVLGLRNVMSRDEQPIRVLRIGEKAESKKHVAIAFANPAPRFWHIDFPPADWDLAQT